MCEPLVLETNDEHETQYIGRRIAATLRGGERLALSGELGAGKTCLVRGVAEGLGIAPAQVRSPSFTSLVEYEGGRLPLYHVDLFRLRPGAVDPLELREYLYSDGVVAVEWFEKLPEPLEDFVEISITFVGPSARRLVAVVHGVGYDSLWKALRETCPGR